MLPRTLHQHSGLGPLAGLFTGRRKSWAKKVVLDFLLVWQHEVIGDLDRRSLWEGKLGWKGGEAQKTSRRMLEGKRSRSCETLLAQDSAL